MKEKKALMESLSTLWKQQIFQIVASFKCGSL